MHIDWFVFFAQIVNFLILVYLLKRFLYGRIVKAMDARETRIRQAYEEAEKCRCEARELADGYQRKQDELRQNSERMLNEAREEAESYRKDLLQKTRDEIEAVRTRWRETVDREKDTFLEDLRKRAGMQVYAIARRALADLAGSGLESRMADVFIDRIRDLGSDEVKIIRDAVRTSGGVVKIQSAFHLSPEIRQRVGEAVRRSFDTDGVAVDFDENPDVISGLELRTAGHKMAWSLGDYLESLEENFALALQQEAQSR
ncbi:MAG: hypothetical protein PHG91_04785 [Syntrophales bacterium]|jgi:F-type H+-transporting ATPase subunit b|nr:hypothetical protein [Syntrophales bacterium]MDD5533272.1 hypothetical protein [Syntrophales bacterium]HPL63211.1 hypothetical protein [Syntrophales bacterium]